MNHYSTWEIPHMAQSCPDNPALLHVNSERVLLRVVGGDGRDVGPGQRGRVFVTALANDVMPLINYDLGDWAIVGAPCPCGRGFPTEQTGPDAVTFLVVAAPGFRAGMVEALREGLGRLVGPRVAVSVELVDRIPWEPSGKRPIIKVRKPSAGGPAPFAGRTGSDPGRRAASG